MSDKKTDCKYYEPVVEFGYSMRWNEEPEREPELIDEVCTCKEKGGPLHHDEYTCKGCPFYTKK